MLRGHRDMALRKQMLMRTDKDENKIKFRSHNIYQVHFGERDEDARRLSCFFFFFP